MARGAAREVNTSGVKSPWGASRGTRSPPQSRPPPRQALALVARRVDAEPVAVIFGTRDLGAEDDLAGLPDLVLGPLSGADARDLLASAIPGRLDERVRDRIVAESGGNPLALLELPGAVTAAGLAGGFGVGGQGPLAGRIERSFLRRIASLPKTTQRLLLLAARRTDRRPTPAQESC